MALPDDFPTERLHLRRPAPGIFASFAQDPEVTRYLAWRPHRTLDDTRAFLERRMAPC